MAFIKSHQDEPQIGDYVKLTEKIEAMSGYFEEGTVVLITDIDPQRGYSFTDEFGNRLIECGWNNCLKIK